MALIERDEFLAHLDRVHDGISGIHTRLDDLNGRTREVEQVVAVHADRFTEARREATKAATRAAGKWGIILAGVGALTEVFHRWWPR